jgi:hypothetical protein
MKRTSSLAAVILILCSVTTDLSAQTRIRFARGAVRTDVSGTLNGFRSKRTYVIRVRSGQTLRTQQVGGSRRPITISVRDPRGNDVSDADASCNNRKEISPTEAGDYTIEVFECQKADPWRGRFTFRVTVR